MSHQRLHNWTDALCVFFIFIFSPKKRVEFAALRMEEDFQENFCNFTSYTNGKQRTPVRFFKCLVLSRVRKLHPFLAAESNTTRNIVSFSSEITGWCGKTVSCRWFVHLSSKRVTSSDVCFDCLVITSP